MLRYMNAQLHYYCYCYCYRYCRCYCDCDHREIERHLLSFIQFDMAGVVAG